MTTSDPENQARIFRALSVETRVEIVRLLAGRTLCVGALSRRLGVSAGAVSQHLRVLRDAGLVSPDRRGAFVHYHLTPDAEARCREALAALFAAGNPTKKGEPPCAARSRNAKNRKR